MSTFKEQQHEKMRNRFLHAMDRIIVDIEQSAKYGFRYHTVDLEDDKYRVASKAGDLESISIEECFKYLKQYCTGCKVEIVEKNIYGEPIEEKTLIDVIWV